MDKTYPTPKQLQKGWIKTEKFCFAKEVLDGWVDGGMVHRGKETVFQILVSHKKEFKEKEQGKYLPKQFPLDMIVIDLFLQKAS